MANFYAAQADRLDGEGSGTFGSGLNKIVSVFTLDEGETSSFRIRTPGG